MKQNYKTGFLTLLCIALLGTLGAQTGNSFGTAPQSANNQNNLRMGDPPQVQSGTSRAWVHVGGTPFQWYKTMLSSTVISPIGPTSTFVFPGASVYNASTNRVYVIDQGAPYALYSFDTTTGVRTFLLNCTGVPLGNFTGLTWDAVTNTMYGVGSSIAASQIFTLNLTTGVCTPIGAPTAVCAGAISVSCSPGGILYSMDIVSDNLFRWNKVTGVPTLVGPLGYDANFGQDSQFDLSDGQLYGAVYNQTVGAAQLRIIDTIVGGSLLIGNYTGQATTIAIRPNCTFSGMAGNVTSNSICFGSSVTFTGSGAPYLFWSGGVTDGVPFTPASTNTYTVTGTNIQGCTGQFSVPVTVNPAPTVVANVTANSVCAGNSVTFTGSGASTYNWTGGVSDGVPFTPVSTNTYTVTGTDVNGCSNSATTTVTVNALPAVTANTTASAVCIGSPVTLSGSGASSYVWTGGVLNNISFTPTVTDTYTVTGTDVNGCTDTDVITVSVNALPTVTASATADSICSGSSVTLSGGGAMSYTWTSSVVDNVPFAPATTNTYTVTGTDANGCSNTSTITVIVNPTPTVNIGPDITQCGGSITLDAGNPGSSYFWSNSTSSQQTTVNTSGTYYVSVVSPAGCIGTDTANITLNSQPLANLGPDIAICQPTTILDAGNPGSTYAWSNAQTTQTVTVGSGTYSVLVTDPSGCTVNDTIVVTTSAPPVVTASQDTAICPGGTATLTASGAMSYLWSNNAVGSPTTVTPATNTSYYVTGTDANGCQSTDLVVVTILSNANALFTSNVVGATASFTNQSTGAFTYSWNFGDASPANTTASPTHVYTANGTYTVTLTVTGPCGVDTYTMTVTITEVGVGENEIENTLSIFPNPNNGQFTVSFSMEEAKDVTVELMDVAGRVISSTKHDNVLSVTQTIDGTELADGVYFVRIIAADEVVTKKVVVQK